MKLPAFFLCLLLVFTGCGKKSPPPDASNSSQNPANPAAPATPAPPATAAQSSALFRLEVNSNRREKRTLLAALLSRDEAARLTSVARKVRCALTVLHGVNMGDSRSGATSLTAIRESRTPDGQVTYLNCAAWILDRDPATDLALIAFEEYVPSTDPGFRLGSAKTGAQPRQALRLSMETVPATAPEAHGRPLHLLKACSGNFSPDSGTAEFSPLEVASEQSTVTDCESSVVLSAPDALHGFIVYGNGPDGRPLPLVPVLDYQPKNVVPILRPIGFGVGSFRNSEVQVKVSVETPLPAGISQPTLFYKSLASPAAASLPEVKDHYPQIEFDNQRKLSAPESSPGDLTGHLEAAFREGEEQHFLVQLGWGTGKDPSPSIFARPFLASVKRLPAGPEVKVTGLKNLNDPTLAARPPEKVFPLEAPVRELQPIAGGREVLLQLDGAPYWKRFSMTRNEWLPLPAGNLSQAYFSGDLTSLYMLNRGSVELARFDLADLKARAQVKLPTGVDYLAVAAGANTQSAPIYLLTAKDILAVDAATLAIRPSTKENQNQAFGRESHFRARGDGLAVSLFGSYPASLVYANDLFGVQRGYFKLQTHASDGVSAYFTRLANDGWIGSAINPEEKWEHSPRPPQRDRGGRGQHWLLPNSPVIFSLGKGDERSVPPRPAYVECFSLFETTPFFEFDAAELAGLEPGWMHEQSWFALDPYSLRVANLDRGRKSWTVRKLTADPNHPQPVLLNWPDPNLIPNADFKFQPVLLGAGALDAHVRGASRDLPLKSAPDGFSFRYPADEVMSALVFDLKILGPGGGSLTYPIPLRSTAVPNPIVRAGAAPPKADPEFGLNLTSLDRAKAPGRTVPSSFHFSSAPIVDVLGPVAGHLAIVTATSVDFYSLQAKKVTGSIVAPPKATYFSGSDFLIEYNLAGQVLTRIQVPDGRRGLSLTVPARIQLKALGLGLKPGSPITLSLESRAGEKSQDFGDFVASVWLSNHALAVLNPDTLRADGWAQPQQSFTPSQTWSVGVPGAVFATEPPKRLAGAFDGRFLVFPSGFLTISPGQSILSPYPDLPPPHGKVLDVSPIPSMTGSVAYQQKVRTAREDATGFSGSMRLVGTSACGRYQFLSPNDDPKTLELRTLDDGRTILHLTRILNYQYESGVTRFSSEFKALLLGETGPMVFFQPKGTSVQIVDVDVPRLAAELDPESLHVVSQPPPMIMEGGVYEYQVRANNPALVGSMRLASEVAGASVSPQGLLRYTAPAKVENPTRVEFTLELQPKSGGPVLHEFSVIVVPVPRPPPPPPRSGLLPPNRGI